MRSCEGKIERPVVHAERTRGYIRVSENRNLNVTLLFDTSSMHYCRRSCPAVSRPQKPHSIAPNCKVRLVNMVKLGWVVVLTAGDRIEQGICKTIQNKQVTGQLLVRDLKVETKMFAKIRVFGFQVVSLFYRCQSPLTEYRLLKATSQVFLLSKSLIKLDTTTDYVILQKLYSQ